MSRRLMEGTELAAAQRDVDYLGRLLRAMRPGPAAQLVAERRDEAWVRLIAAMPKRGAL